MIYCEFGENLKALRKQRNLTQTELGSHIGLSKAVVSKYENGLGYPTYDILIRFAKFFGVTTDYLLGVAQGKTINVTGLSDSQIDILHNLIAEFKK
ncbi:MAG: helix-turn-helix domain-containing protein [Clostridia bacterium]|nr:helix-turn-helix domain-containing protein [Clostridia bacterium]